MCWFHIALNYYLRIKPSQSATAGLAVYANLKGKIILNILARSNRLLEMIMHYKSIAIQLSTSRNVASLSMIVVL